MRNVGEHHMHFFGLHFEWGFWIIIIMVMIAVVIVAILIYKESSKRISKSNLGILKKRYAKGEISKEKFERKNKDL
jgi:putative membrane protein